MSPITDNPFAALTAVVAPAILTNACSVLALGTANRVARVVDRTRVVTATMAGLDENGAAYKAYCRQLDTLRFRGKLLLHALRLFYTALAAFAASALIAIIGSVLVAFPNAVAFQVSAGIGMLIGAGGVIGLVSGCVMVVNETRLAIQGLGVEIESALAHGGSREGGSPP